MHDEPVATFNVHIFVRTDKSGFKYKYPFAATEGSVIVCLVGAVFEDEDPAVSFTAFPAETIDGTSHDLTIVSKTVTYDNHGLAAGDFVFPALKRDANNESDTLDDDLWVEGWGIKFEVTS